MTYKSAIESISCIISACDLDTQVRVIKHIVKNSPDYKSAYMKKHNIPSHMELMKSILDSHKPVGYSSRQPEGPKKSKKQKQ
ncbi:hypothetical protein [Spongiivirga citrea]|uniref:Uncharacterized protein n=1 Tax=Spongiivirga citrea TaxID=1481457 RepID=A0A6M0CPA0_9FLAO|nr:hypothetical protein [Spongiivirga citrea]NER18763.1 hypothetical protein [Spongiivirga citrea]